MVPPLTRIEQLLIEVPARFAAMSEEDPGAAPAPDKWCPREVLGHLIDSAIHNLLRFTYAQLEPGPFRIVPYPQTDLVRVNAYRELPIAHLLHLWKSLNRQIAEIIRRLPAAALDRPVILPNGESKDLAWLIGDYTAHMDQHLRSLGFPAPVA